MSEAPRRRVAILANLVAPYRLPLYRTLAERFRTTVLVSGREGNRATWLEAEAELPGIEVRRSAGFSLRRRVGSDEVYDERFLHFPLGQLIDLLRTRPDAVVTIEMGMRTALALLYGTLTRTPVWVWWGGTPHTERDLDTARRVVRAVLARWARRWISYGASSTEYLLSLGVPRSRILQIQNCVDETLFTAPVEPAERILPGPVLLYTGQMIGRKGVDALLDAAAILQREGRTFALLLVGDGPERAALEARAERLGLRNVHFRAGRRPAEMPAVYRCGDFLIFPTREDVWGLVVNEALWSGVPVLASIHAGCAAELLPPDRLFDPDDLEGFAATLRSALDGKIGPPDTSGLKRAAEVGRAIADEIERAIGGPVA